VNVRRIIGRVTRRDPAPGEAAAPLPPREIQAAADALVDPDRPADWTHAMMDLGATLCRPVRPSCAACPVQTWCAFAGGAARASGAIAGPEALLPAAPPPDRPRAVPFEATTRWLRGRIVDRLCSVPPGTSVAFEGPLGLHAPAAVSAALASLAADGLVELDGSGAARLAGERP
jgi:A/G-specific adenine glycosylase